MRRLFRWTSVVLGAALFALSVPIVSKSLPIVRDRECYRSFFPKERFLAKIDQPVPEWMQQQLEADFQSFNTISLEAIEETFRHIEASTQVRFYRYRIINNKLYSFQSVSGTDNSFEKALKTLLLYAKVPNVDFIYCPMDGLPEPYMPANFYLTENQAPIFAKARINSAPYIVLIPDQFSLSQEWFDVANEILSLNPEISWEQKKEIALWRGGLTDIGIPNGSFVPNFKDCPRFKISKLSSISPEWVNAGLQWSDCPDLDKLLQNERAMKNSASKKEHLFYKYLPVLDGHMCTYPGYQWRLLSNSVCFKQESDQIQWFHSALKPYVHYVPIKNDMSDLIGQIQWAKAHEPEVKQIVKNAQDFAANHLMIEDDYLYLYLALKYYAALQQINWDQIQRDPNWTCIQYRKRQQLVKSWRRFAGKYLMKI